MRSIGIRRGRTVLTTSLVLLATVGPAFATQENVSSSALDQKGITTVQDAIMALERAEKKTKSTPVRLVGDVGSFFGPAAYPVEALRANQQGRSVVRVDIDAKGFPKGCSVISSSGSSTLDQATCRIATTRMQFSAARDEKGRPIPGQYTLPVHWALPAPAVPMPLNLSVETQITVGTDGTVESCDTQPVLPPGTPGLCLSWPVGRAVMAPPRRDGKPVKAHVVISMDVVTTLDP